MTTGVSMRERTRRAVRGEIRAVALTLFEGQGYRATTIDQIARASEISVRTFFRYFETKEDVLVGDASEQLEPLLAAIAARPADESVWTSLRHALGSVAQVVIDDPDALRVSRLIHTHPELRARHLEKRARWAAGLTPAVTARLSGDDVGLRSESIVGAALACFDAAVADWTGSDGSVSLDVLVDRALSYVAVAAGAARAADGSARA